MDSLHNLVQTQTVNDESYDDMYKDWLDEQANRYDAEDAALHHCM